MSDLEATGSRAQAAAPITAIASGKLRAFAGHGPRFSESDGLVDAFAEVFASIAASSSQPIEKPDSSGDVERGVISDRNNSEREDDSISTESEASDSDTHANVDPLLAVSDQQIVIEDETHLSDESNLFDDTSSQSLDGEPDQVVAQEATIAAVKESESEAAATEDAKAPEIITQNVVETEDTSDHKRDRREAPSVDLAESNPRHGSQDGRAANPKQQVELGDESDQAGEQTLSQSTEQSDAESPRVSRRRYTKDDEASENASRPASQSNHNRADSRPNAVNNGRPTADTAVDPSSQSSPASRASTASRNVESVIASVQGATSKVDRVNTSSGPQTGTRGSTQAIAATETRRSDPRAAPDAQPNKNNAAETVSRVKLIQRVSKAFQHLGPEGGVVRLRLAPAEMGAVRVEMRIDQRKVQARVVAETEAASAALREHLPDLRARLESFGMQVEKLEIETDANDQQHSSLFDADSQQNQQQWQRQGRSHLERQDTKSNETVSPSVSQSTSDYQSDAVTGGVDVRL